MKPINYFQFVSGDDLETVVKKLDLASFLNNMADKSKTSIDCLTKVQLVAACKKYSICTQGNKDVLKVALKSHLSKNNIQFQVRSYIGLEYNFIVKFK